NPELAALRELQEETGYKASKIEKLVEFFTSPGVVKEKIYVYMASDLTFVGQHLDADEYLNVKTYTAEEVEKMIKDNELQDGKSIIAYELWKNRKSL
ncbi:MAG: NUDIX hydrolase, partial [Erysipelotrichaceae bacterium]|nr:NUDIX hydrolase [Erysipelotrichaceae bacterium]